MGKNNRTWLVRAAAALTAGAIAVSVGVVGVPAAQADSAPLDPSNPATPPTVTADALPTVQIDGVAWQQVIVGDTVYVAGKFSTARPAGAAPGTGTVARNNILAYRLSTGELISSFAPNLNAQALSIAASPDGSRIYVGGDFTAVNGATVWRAAALDATTGALITGFLPKMAASVRAIVATGNTVYMGGLFTAVGTLTRNRLAAVQASDGTVLPWNPSADNGRVNALVLSPDGKQLIAGGTFTTLNGSSKPGYGLGAVDTVTGASLPLPVNNVVRNAGAQSSIMSLSSDGTSFYGSGYIYGTGGNLEGSFAGNWSTGDVKWIEDCHGDTYGIFASSTAVYVASHSHYCGNLGGFPQTSPLSWHRALAFSKAATGTLTKDIYGYPSFTGQPAPSPLDWYPDLDTGTASGQNQGPWTVTGTDTYVAMAGEFMNVNNSPQQGLVRYAVKDIAPNKQGPRLSGAKINPTLTYTGPGTVHVQWQADWDRDSENLQYQLIRDSNPTPIYTATQASTFWKLPAMDFTDTGLKAGSHTYRLSVTDPTGNTVKSETVAVSVPADPPNAAPTAAFTATASALTASVDGSASSDPDGSIASYAWDFGDGSTGTGPTADHTYAAAGTYTIKLTVTDNGGATNAVSHDVSVTAPPPGGQTTASDTFGRTLASGWGSADTGGPWTLNGSASYFSVGNGTGAVVMNKATAGPSAFLAGLSTSSADAQVKFGLDKLADGGGTQISLTGRRVGTDGEYRAKVKVAANGAVGLDVTRQLGTTATTLVSKTVAGLTYAVGDQLQVRFQVTGTAPTTLNAKVWKVGTSEPSAWLISTTDASAALQAAGGAALVTYLSGSTTNAPVTARFDDFQVNMVGGGA